MKKNMNIKKVLLAIIMTSTYLSANAQEEPPAQSRESAAVDPTAAQWSYQFAAEWRGDYLTDEISPGVPRPNSHQGFWQFRLVAPIPKTEKIPITMLPRLTLRAVQNQEGRHGFANSDIFILGIINDWGTGRWGLGPQINFPAQSGFGNTSWGGGLAAAITQRAWEDRLFFALLLQQTWSNGKASNLGINTIIVAQLGQGWYVGNGDFVISYDWDNGGVFVPFGLRLGKAFINEKRTINAYVEYRTWSAAPNWEGPIADNALRLNIQWQIPVNFK